ncbi:MAG: hypothetical protein M1819_005738 [Sarea resinae]|nr:MAG: hypothetical protein M1819_005738 [Sarea resinae]
MPTGLSLLSALGAASFALWVQAAQQPDVSSTLQNILANTHGSPLYTYPTDLTRGIVPKMIHSHNDYWRDIPFYSALSVGAVSVEADVWLYNDTLYVRRTSLSLLAPEESKLTRSSGTQQVGHEESALTTSRTFESLYITPILETLQAQNPPSPFLTAPTKNGVFDTASTQTLYLFVDVKTAGEATWPSVVSALGPLRDAGYLTTVNSSGIPVRGPVTVIGTGNTPLDQVQTVTAGRDYFYDAPLPFLDTTFANITSAVSPIASYDFNAVFGAVPGTQLNDIQLATLRAQVAAAHAKGILVRYWDLPGWPISTRNGIWRQLRNEGADFVNADDLLAAAGFSGESEYW